MKKIPYGISNFEKVITENYYYVDKTKYIEILENYGSPYLFFLRPRRFGKSLFLSMLSHYYDINRKDEFEKLFGETYIGKNPTPKRNCYPILRFNFSMVKTFGTLEEIRNSFVSYVHAEIMDFIRKYKEVLSISDDTYDRFINFVDLDVVRNLFVELRNKDINVFLLVDEYDNFANNILVEHGSETYISVTHAGGFLRNFFTNLKGLTDNREIDRLFITGVSPLVMADVTSGFNIGDNISQDSQLSSMVGFNHEEVSEILDYYGQFNLISETKEKILEDFGTWYNGYCFNDELEKIYNTVSVLYYFNKCVKNNRAPVEFIDENMRTDYGKFRFLLTENNKLNGNFSVLRKIIENKEITGNFVRSFSLNDLVYADRFQSLLFYLGFTSIKEVSVFGEYTYTIPNKLVNILLWEFVHKSLEDIYDLRLNKGQLLGLFRKMTTGEWKPAFEYIIKKFYEATSIRDFVFHEEGIKTFILAYLNMATYYNIYSEKEIERGYCDIFIEPEKRLEKEIKYGYIIELKYIKAEHLKSKVKTQAAIDEAVKNATKQLNQYDGYKNNQTKRLIIVASAKKLLYMEEALNN
jgi:hypothetical protein